MMHATISAPAQPLTRLEWQVVALAIREAGDARCGGQGWFGRLLARVERWLGGAAPVRPLGDPRLDALRRFVCASRHGMRADGGLADTLLGFGYTPAQLAALAQLSR